MRVGGVPELATHGEGSNQRSGYAAFLAPQREGTIITIARNTHSVTGVILRTCCQHLVLPSA